MTPAIPCPGRILHHPYEYIFGPSDHPLKSEASKSADTFLNPPACPTPSESYSFRQREFDKPFSRRVTFPGALCARAVDGRSEYPSKKLAAIDITADVFEVRSAFIASIRNRTTRKIDGVVLLDRVTTFTTFGLVISAGSSCASSTCSWKDRDPRSTRAPPRRWRWDR